MVPCLRYRKLPIVDFFHVKIQYQFCDSSPTASSYVIVMIQISIEDDASSTCSSPVEREKNCEGWNILDGIITLAKHTKDNVSSICINYTLVRFLLLF